jgi:hypothetical protein
MYYVQLPTSFQSYLQIRNANEPRPLFGEKQETPYMWDIALTNCRKLQLVNKYLQETRMQITRLTIDCNKVAELRDYL